MQGIHELVAEKIALDRRLTKLLNYLAETQHQPAPSDEERDLMNRQANAMQEYSRALADRIGKHPDKA